MEQEIDLRPFLQAIVRQWRLIAGALAVVVVATVVITLALPRVATARGDVLVVARTTQVALDARFADRDATMYTNAINQRQALVDLASSPRLESLVAQKLGVETYEPGLLSARVTITSRSDLLQIEATGETPEEAQQLAEAWASSYETLVNEVYSANTSASLEAPLAEAQQRYERSQAELSAFYASGDLVRAQQSVARFEGLLAGGNAAQLSRYTEHLSRTQELGFILDDARSIQAQYEEGEVVDLGTSLAALAVRARLADSERLPILLNFDTPEALAGGQASSADLARFVRVLSAERDRRLAEAEVMASDLAQGNGAAVGLAADVRARYEADLATARSTLSQAEGQERRLVLQRDVSLRALEVIQAKRDEGQIDQVVPEVNVRFLGAALQKPSSLLTRLVINLALAVAASLAFVLAFIVGREVLRRGMPAPAGARAPAERVAEKPVATD